MLVFHVLQTLKRVASILALSWIPFFWMLETHVKRFFAALGGRFLHRLVLCFHFLNDVRDLGGIVCMVLVLNQLVDLAFSTEDFGIKAEKFGLVSLPATGNRG